MDSPRYHLPLALLTSLGIAGCHPVASDPALSAHPDVRAALARSDMTVFKSENCACCKSWIHYAREEGFTVTSHDHENMLSIKSQLGLPQTKLKSCLTAVVDGYLIEGHVPADDIRRLLAERPPGVIGISAPGMPMDSPGMGSREPKGYSVFAFTESGKTSVFSAYE